MYLIVLTHIQYPQMLLRFCTGGWTNSVEEVDGWWWWVDGWTW